METKICTRCNKEKELSFFRWYGNRGIYSGVCKECSCGHPPLKRYTFNTADLKEKECNICKHVLPIERFGLITKGGKSYYQSSCRTCRNRSYGEPNKKKNGRGRRKRLKQNYGITEAIYQTMLTEQDGLCKICSKPVVEGKVLSIDHCHTTGKVRGLLCSNCNIGLGMFKDNIEILKSAIKYLNAE